jgi:hypothetical protein
MRDAACPARTHARARNGHERADASELSPYSMDAWFGAWRGIRGLAVPEVRKERPEALRCWKTTGRADPAGPCYRCRGPDSADPPPLARGQRSRAAPRVADGARRHCDADGDGRSVGSALQRTAVLSVAHASGLWRRLMDFNRRCT